MRTPNFLRPLFTYKFFVLAGFVLSVTPALHGQDAHAVKWRGDYATSDALLNLGKAKPLEMGEIWSYDLDTPKSPLGNYLQDAPSARFYGVIETESTSTPVGSLHARVQNQPTSTDRLVIRSPGVEGSPASVTLKGMLFWKKENFLGSAANTDLSLSSLHDITADIDFVRGDAELRFALRSGGKWYLSEQVWAVSTGSGGKTHERALLTGLKTSRWGEWNISDSTAPLDPPPESPMVEGGSLTNITAIGFYFSSVFNKNNRATFEFSSFAVSLAP